MTRKSVQEYLAAQRERYARGSRVERTRLLDEIAAVTRYHRKAEPRSTNTTARLGKANAASVAGPRNNRIAGRHALRLTSVRITFPVSCKRPRGAGQLQRDVMGQDFHQPIGVTSSPCITTIF